MQAEADFFGVAVVVEVKQAVEDFATAVSLIVRLNTLSCFVSAICQAG
jgi:hypothetical protein